MKYQYTNQEAFDLVLKKIREQGCPSVTPNGLCLYKDEEGNRCAAGHFIPEGHPAETEERNWSAIIKTHPELADIANQVLVEDMQVAHDDASLNEQIGKASSFIGAFNSAMKKLAVDWDLKYTEPNE